MKPVQLPGERIASAGAAALGLANVAYQAALTYRPTPDAAPGGPGHRGYGGVATG